MQILFAGMKRREPYLPAVTDHDDYKFWLYNEVRWLYPYNIFI